MQEIVYSNDVGRNSNQIVSVGFDLLVTMLTLSLQSLAYANRDGRMRQVFGHVSDSAGAARGFGVTGCAI